MKSSKLAKCPDKIGRGSAMPVLTAHVYEHTFMSSGAVEQPSVFRPQHSVYIVQ